MKTTSLKQPKIVTRDEWFAARKQLLNKEKQWTRMREELTAQRGELPWVKVEKPYVFAGPAGPETLADLFDGRSQLIVYHFMFGPGWDEGCVGCSFLADNIDGARPHLEAHDVTLVVVSRAPLTELEAFKQRMGWKFKWVSSDGSDFNYDFHVSFTKEDMARGKGIYNFEESKLEIDELSGTSVFTRDERGDVFHTYSAYARGDEQLLVAYDYLEMTPKGRNEHGPRGNLSDWVRHHDRYEADGFVDATGRYQAADQTEAACGCGADDKGA
ncbi:MAG: thioredoxin family protein [Chthoniobacteraceae bacterium]